MPGYPAVATSSNIRLSQTYLYILPSFQTPLFKSQMVLSPDNSANEELMQRQRRRLRKRHLKSAEFALPQTLSRSTPSRLIRQMLANFFEVVF